MCPLWPLHIIVMYLMAMLPIWFVACKVVAGASDSISVKFTPSEIKELFMYDSQMVQVETNIDPAKYLVTAIVNDATIASVSPDIVFKKDFNSFQDVWKSSFNVTGDFIGYTDIKMCLKSNKNVPCVKTDDSLKVKVIRKPRIIDKIFTYSVIILVSIIFINFGCALDVRCLKQALLRPIGPVIGLLSHFLFLPLLSFGIGQLLFPNSHALRLGLFFTGISPAGGASNIWTYSLGGNLNLSVTMTAVSTLASFAMIPLWVFTLGPVIFSDSPMGVPYNKITTSAIGLVIPLAIGYLLQVYCKKISNVMVRILKPFSAALIIFIIIFAIVTNVYLFKLFTWEILVAGIGLPLLGYLAGFGLSSLLHQSPEDRLAIAIETGVQNTGIAIFLLKFCLPQPEADLTTVAPVAVALMTPLPLLILLLARKTVWKWKKDEQLFETQPYTEAMVAKY